MKESDWKLLDRKAMSVVRLSLSRNIALHTIKAKTTKEMLQILMDMYEKPSAANKVHLMRRLFNLKMSETTGVVEHLNEFNLITTQLSAVGIKFDDEIHALILLSSLPESWNRMVTAVSASAGKEKLKFDEVRNLVVSEEIRRKESGLASGSTLSTENRGRTKSKSKSNRDRSRSKSKSNIEGKKDRSQIKCWNCEEYGHFKSQCKEQIKDQKEKTSANAAAESSGDDLLILSVNSLLESWVLDSRASFHSCDNSEVMEQYTPGNFGEVYLADDEPLKIVGKGTVHVKTPNGCMLKLNGVRHIPGLRRNLLSIGQLDEEGYAVAFDSRNWKITKGALLVAKGKKEGTLYMTTNSKDCIDVVAAATNDLNLWHCRLDHMSEKGMKELCSKGKLPGLKTVEVGLCEDCIFGKQKRVSFSKGRRAIKPEKLELVHTDLWGPAEVTSLGGSAYYMTFIDDATRKVWVYFLKNKSDAFDAFRRWKARVETESGLKLKCLRSDNGGECELHEFKNFCAENEVRMEKTTHPTLSALCTTFFQHTQHLIKFTCMMLSTESITIPFD
ncbi:unnamed protein product [Cuscuta epithymum]|uniref:Retrovirus-related Pol polyprotein from transposon TNT 1-94 n=1 Tax=Cuscuta epithymum TaxID=186058 RepID=A0AAV0G8X5_9ASTE|nr:unnamed protein product [Cuscuta epithymum]